MGNYKTTATEARLKVLELIYKAQSSHIGSNLSVIDILTVLFSRKSPNDLIILSAGWKACAFYYFLYREGTITLEQLDSYCQPGSPFIGLTEPMKGVLFAGGSMGMGLPAAVGFALAKKIKGEPGRVYCVMSDGEQAIGTTYESALIARQHYLDNLTVIIDSNGYQAMGKTSDILTTSVRQTFQVGAGVVEVDGHDHEKLQEAIEFRGGNVYVILAHTTKGKGVDFMENNNHYHYKNLTDDEYRQAQDILSRAD
jgi:transketolase